MKEKNKERLFWTSSALSFIAALLMCVLSFPKETDAALGLFIVLTVYGIPSFFYFILILVGSILYGFDEVGDWIAQQFQKKKKPV